MSQCQINANFSDFQTNGMSSTILWENESSDSVICYSSDWQPSFYVNQDSLQNVRITGQMYIDQTSGDDDFIGFVFGYKAPTIGTAANDNHYYLFDWKKVGQHAPSEYGGFLAKEGFSICYTDGIIPGDPINTYQYFWGHEAGEHFYPIAEKYGNNLGWEYNTVYNFELIYSYNKIIIRINGEEIFDVDGCFPSGLFGLYTFNQNGATFSNVSIEQMYNISYSTDQVDYCEEIPIEFGFLDTTCAAPPSSLTEFEWDFGDGSSPEYNLFPNHIFFDPGPYNIELRITNTEGCIDTLTKFIFIEPKPQIEQHPQDQNCYVGDQVKFNVSVNYVDTYKWFYKTKDMSFWRKVQNNGYFTGANTPELTIYNVRPIFDSMQVRCQVNGKCYNQVTTQDARVLISDIPVRAFLEPIDDQICTYDSTIVLLTLQEPYQIDKANIRLLYDPQDFEFANYTTYLQNMSIDLEADSNFIDLMIDVTDPANLDEVIVASLNFNSVGEQTKLSEFTWDSTHTWFINENQDTILKYLYNSNIQLNQPLTSGLNDSIRLCQGEELSLNGEQFLDIIWNTGETSSTIVPQNDGFYSVSLIDINHCQSSESVYVHLDNQPVKPLSIQLQKDYYCSFDDSVSFEVLGGLGNELNIQYGDFQITDSLKIVPQYTIKNPGSDFVISTSWLNLCGQSDELEKDVQVIPEAIPDVHLYSDIENPKLGDRVSIFANISDEGSAPYLQWYIDDQLVQMGSDTIYITDELSNHQEYKVILHSNAQCVLGPSNVTDQLYLELVSNNEYYIPNVVTPDGDGVNDSFRVHFNNADIDYYQLQIFDLRGRLLFSTDNIYEDWNGSGTLPNGGMEILTYFISYKYSNSTQESLSGKFLLKK